MILDTPSITAGADDVEVRLGADSLTLLNSAAAHSDVGVLRGGSLSLAARDVVLGPGSVNIDAYDLLSIAAEREIIGEGNVRLATRVISCSSRPIWAPRVMPICR